MTATSRNPDQTLPAAYIHGIGTCFGAPTPISSLVRRDATRGQVLAMRALGFEQFYLCTTSRVEMAMTACARSLQASGHSPADIGALLCCSNTLGADGDQSAVLELGAAVATELGLRDASVHSMDAQGCGDIIRALLRARQECGAGAGRDVLILSIDIMEGSVYSRLNPGWTVHSDSAVGCVVSARAKGFRLGAGAYRQFDAGTKTSVIRDTVDSVLGASSSRMDSLARIVGPNFHVGHLPRVEEYFNVPRTMLYNDNLARNAHCLAGDPLINLVDFFAIEIGQELLLYALAQDGFGAIVVEKV